jgi:RNA polymerase sigma-70 factor (ECF subfamily)
METDELRAVPASGTVASSETLDWNRVYADQLPRVYNFFRFRVGISSDIEDLTARTFEKAWKARDRYRRDRATFSTWLFGIARNVATDHLRSIRRHLPLEAACDVPSDDSPEGDAFQGSDIKRLLGLMAELPEHQRELIALKYGAALNNRLIASLTGLSESNVGTILARVVGKLRSQW